MSLFVAMEAVQRLRLISVRLALVLTVAAAGIAYIFDPVVAQALALGGIAGVLAFWIIALRVEKLATEKPDAVHSVEPKYALLRLAIYVAVLIRGYTLDPEHLRGLIAAAAGLFIIRLVLVFLAFTGLDLKQGRD